MTRKLITLVGVVYLVGFAVAGVVPEEKQEKAADKEVAKPKPNIVKDYVCLRDGDLCHPDFAKNRGIYVSCSNGVAWEQTCPKCTYHPVDCPTKSLWFDGEKCDWASPKLATQPCMDFFPMPEPINNNNMSPKDVLLPAISLSEQDSLMQSLQSGPIKDMDKNQWPVHTNSMVGPGSMYFKSPKSSNPDMESEPSQGLEEEGSKEMKSSAPAPEEVTHYEVQRKSTESEGNDVELPTYLSTSEGTVGSKVVRLNEPVYALVSSPDGTGKQVLMRVMQPFVLDEAARGLLPNMNFIQPYAFKE
ncbi:unnamed protein product [Orchesella dallaii]|uniref:Uncharacterized protein n=1 Tax=Orchesella dallaii TaxID=48710 RepID=A0ABP1QU12_9HEXA